MSFYLVLFSFSVSTTRAPPAPRSPHLCPCTYYAWMSPCGLFFSEYCSNNELAINHIALSPRRALLCVLPAHCAPPIGRRRSSFGLSERDIGAIINPAFLLGPVDWKKGALLELSIMPCLARRAFGAAAAAAGCDALSAERGGALHTNRDVRERANYGTSGGLRLIKTQRLHPVLCQQTDSYQDTGQFTC